VIKKGKSRYCTIDEPEIEEETIGRRPMGNVIGYLERMLSLSCSQNYLQLDPRNNI